MNRRQAKKKLKKEYGIITPRHAAPRITKQMDDKTPNETIAELGLELARGIKLLCEALAEAAEKIGEVIREVVEMLRKAKPRQKYKPVKSLVKPYRAPFIKVRYRARANL